ncbi:MAG TPA: sigma-70 family RNA polymerase sigma factor [Verrucomicrobiae bacterium]|nr:sigma-70 family RNA polymerase sigma factor [Verrucomicrobiae bacterium]
MPTSKATTDSSPSLAGRFAATRWTVVLTAGQGASPQAGRALEQLCRAYWYPLYAYVRRRGYDVHEAEDLTQEFFARLLAKNYLAGVDPSKGKFRSFLLASLKHFLANEWDRAHAAKRGGGQPLLPLDTQSAETRYRQEPADELTAEKLLERQWALALLDQVLDRLQAEFAADGKSEQFDQLKLFLTEGKGATSYAAMATKLGTTEGAVKVAVHRLRRRYRELLREEIAHTVASPAEIDEEIRHLFAAF